MLMACYSPDAVGQERIRELVRQASAIRQFILIRTQLSREHIKILRTA